METKPCECGCGEFIERAPNIKESQWKKQRFKNRSHAARWTHRNRKKSPHRLWEWKEEFYSLAELYKVAVDQYGLNISKGGFRARLRKYGLPTAITGEELWTLPNKKPRGHYVPDKEDLPREYNLKKIPEPTAYDQKYGNEPDYNIKPRGGNWHGIL